MFPLWKVKGFEKQTSWKVTPPPPPCVWKDGERTVRRAKSGETLVEASRDTDAQIVRYICFMGAKDKPNNLVAGSLQRFPRITGAQQLRQVKRMIGGIGNVLFSICFQTENMQDLRVSLVNLSVAK